MKTIALIPIFLLCLGVVHSAEQENCKPSNCFQIACGVPLCESIQERGPWVLRQDPCECCPGCYIERKEGEECGKGDSTICVEGLKCVDHKCQA
ncbi:uncharacterized protein DDB_G0272420-like [Leptinotarsa decemlineata]|uniref:uncharacterized protein DDB_G0272420-like n=1 Tax=Leptinotarsa decemlineata TaxID=7539 RepID=UPI003D30C832